MKYRFNYGSEVITLPRSAAQYVAAASKDKLRVLFSLAAEPAMTAKKRAESLGMTEDALAAAIAYWSAVEVISVDKPAQSDKENKVRRDERAAATSRKSAGGMTAVGDDSEKEKHTGPASEPKASAKSGRDDAQTGVTALLNETPHMTTRELSSAAVNADNRSLLEHCQQLMGRVFNAAEAERIVAVRSYLGVGADFIALLAKSLKDEGKLTVRAIENTAIELHDKGVADRDALLEYFERREKAHAFEGKVRSLYGLGSRALSPAERKILEKWAALGVSEDMIEYAYALTVDATGGASIKYSNAIVEKWAAHGVKSVAEAKKREEEFRSRTQSKATRQKTGAKKIADETISSFDTDDFFEKALRRSYGDDFFEGVIKGDADAESDGK